MAAGRGSPRRLQVTEQPPQEALSIKKKEMENFWAEVLAGFGGITWSGADLARGTAQARAYGRKHSLYRLCLGGSQCTREREILSSHSKMRGGEASSDSSIALLNSNQMCGTCDLFCSPFASHKLSQALPHRRSRARGTSLPWHNTDVLQGNGDVVSSFIFVD